MLIVRVITWIEPKTNKPIVPVISPHGGLTHGKARNWAHRASASVAAPCVSWRYSRPWVSEFDGRKHMASPRDG
jgi:hypothetical protein